MKTQIAFILMLLVNLPAMAAPLEQIEITLKSPTASAVKGKIAIDEEGVTFNGAELNGGKGYGKLVRRVRPSAQKRNPARACKEGSFEVKQVRGGKSTREEICLNDDRAEVIASTILRLRKISKHE